MKITFTLTPLMFSLFFSLTTFSQEKSPGALAPNNNGVTNRTSSTVTEDYDSRVYNECTSEWVHLKGKITYNIKEEISDKKYFILYQIDLKKVEGIGETTGTVYKGGGIIKDRITAVFQNGHVVGEDIYKVSYKANNSTLIFTQKAHYVASGDDIKVSFNDASDSCK